MKLSYKWQVGIVLVLGSFMSFLDQTIVNIAIPHLQSTFGADLRSVQWVVTVYLLALGAITPITPFVVQMVGSKRAYLFSLAAFTLGSTLCGLAWSLPVLIFFRVVQGVGGAVLFPLTLTLFFREFPPEERGMAMAIGGIPTLVAPALGPVVGGILVTFASWRAIFFINVPIGIVSIVLTALIFRKTLAAERVRFDVPGFFTSAYGLAAVLYALSEASATGWSDPSVLFFLGSGGVILGAFIGFELLMVHRGGSALLDLRLFLNRTFSAGNTALVLSIVGLFGTSFLVPIYLQTLQGYSAFQAGLLLLPQSVATMISTVLGGWLVDRLGDARRVVVPGLVLLAVSAWFLTEVALTTPNWQIALILTVLGFSFGLILQPLTVAAMVHIRDEEQLANGSTLLTVIRSVGGSLGIAVLATVVQSQTRVHSIDLIRQRAHNSTEVVLQKQAELLALHDAFFLTTILTILAVFAALLLQKRSHESTRSLPDSGSFSPLTKKTT